MASWGHDVTLKQTKENSLKQTKFSLETKNKDTAMVHYQLMEVYLSNTLLVLCRKAHNCVETLVRLGALNTVEKWRNIQNNGTL